MNEVKHAWLALVLLLLVFAAGCASPKDLVGGLKGSTLKNLLKGGSAWCAPGDQVGMKYYMLSTVGLEDYKGEQLAGPLCHLTTQAEGLQADFYLDEAALEHFKGNEKAAGNGCMVFTVKDTAAVSEWCFGEKVAQPA